MKPAADDAISFNIDARIDDNARIARAFVSGEWPGDAEEATALLDAICDQWPGGPRLVF